jgi:hypothetical protein
MAGGPVTTAQFVAITLARDEFGRADTVTASDGTVETIVRDAQNRVAQRKSTPPGATMVTTRYSYTSSADSPDLILDGTTNKITARILVLPGGVTVTIPVTGTSTWSYPNIHGDIIATANSSGLRTGRFAYDPYGQPVDNLTGFIGSNTANDNVADNLRETADLAWVGSHTKLYEYTGTLKAMGYWVPDGAGVVITR